MAASFTRRDFLRYGGVTAAFAASMTASPLRAITRDAAAFAQSLPDGGRRQRVLLFHDPSFPTIDSAVYAREALLRALPHADVRTVSADGFAAALREGGVDLVITAHGSAFPEDAGMALLGYLARAGNWLQLGGVPLAVPVRRAADGWEQGPRRTRWHRKLGLTQAFRVDCAEVGRWSAAPGAETINDAASSFACASAFALYWRLTSTKHFPQEDGSAGPRDALLRPLIIGTPANGAPKSPVGADDLPVTAAAVQLDWLHGDYAGGRWILASGDSCLAEDLLGQLASLASCGAVGFSVLPVHARCRPGEPPSLRLRLHRPRRAGKADCLIEIHPDGQAPRSVRATLAWSESLPVGTAEVTLPELAADPGAQPLDRKSVV